MPPKFLICGLEHTGTTLISDLFRQLPGMDSGFECGALLRATPAEFLDLNPFSGNMLKGWGITRKDLEHCCAAPDFDTFYTRLKAASTVLDADTVEIFDKTPRYLSELSQVMTRCDCQIVVSYKDPRAIVCSDFKRAKTDDFDAWYNGYYRIKRRYMQTCYDELVKNADSPRVLAVGLEELAMNSRNMMERMFAHVGETFELGYAIIDTLRYANVKNRTVSADIAFEYKTKLSDANQGRVLDDFAHFEGWFYK